MANVEFTGIHHLKLPVSDLALSREWYERVLGYIVEREFPKDDGVVRGVGGRLPGSKRCHVCRPTFSRPSSNSATAYAPRPRGRASATSC